MINLNYQTDHILYQIFKVNFSNDSPIRIYINNFENRVAFKTDAGYYLQLLTPEWMKLFRSTGTKGNNDNNVSHLEITEIMLVRCKVVNNDYLQDSRCLYVFVSQISQFVSY